MECILIISFGFDILSTLWNKDSGCVVSLLHTKIQNLRLNVLLKIIHGLNCDYNSSFRKEEYISIQSSTLKQISFVSRWVGNGQNMWENVKD
jgi:hypothetical protein